MHKHHIEEMAQALQDGGLVTGKDRKLAAHALTKYWADKCALTWTADDVRGQAESMEVELGDEQVTQVLYLMSHRHDACHGVCWDTIKDYIQEVSE